MPEIHKADPRARRSAILMVVAAGIVGAVALHLMGESSEWLQAWAERDPQRAASILFALMTLGFSVPL
ncbi:MAG: hypothetical protein PVI01_19540, partial [Gemmatimonadales bacterium]